MSKIQDAIDQSRKRAQKTGVAATGAYKRVDLAPAAALTNLQDRPTLTLDADAMEQNCILPFVATKGATSAYMLLRTRLMHRMRGNNWHSVMVTSAVPEDGKTTTAINVSVGISQDVSHSVLLVDFDLERPRIAKSLGLERNTGLSDYLRGDAEWNEIIYNTDVERLFLLPNFDSMGASESLVTPRLLALLEHLKKLDPNLITIFDLPPILSSDSVIAIAPHIDSLLLVISEASTPRGLLQRAGAMIEDVPRAGTVLNRSTEGDSGGYY